jgi:hypothetical protein
MQADLDRETLFNHFEKINIEVVAHVGLDLESLANPIN